MTDQAQEPEEGEADPCKNSRSELSTEQIFIHILPFSAYLHIKAEASNFIQIANDLQLV